MSTDTSDNPPIEYYEIPSFKFTNGDTLPIRVAYRNIYPASMKTALVPTCYGGRIASTLAFTAEGQAFAAHNVIVVAMLGNGESSSPSNTSGFPKDLDYRDCIHAQYELLTKHLAIQELDVVEGFSMGGQQAYYWACMYPDFVKNIVVNCGSAKTSGHNYAFLEGPKAALMNSTDYADGEYRAKGLTPVKGIRAFGRAYCAWLTSGSFYRERLWEKKLGFKSVEDYIKGCGETMFDLFELWDAEDMLILARMWQAGDIGKTREDGDYTKALEAIKTRALVMPCRTDQYFMVEDSEYEMKFLKKAELAPIESVWGHLAGGGGNEEDTQWMSDRIKIFLGQG